MNRVSGQRVLLTLVAVIARRAGAQPAVPAPVVIRAASGSERTIAVRERGSEGGFVRADELASALGGTLTTLDERSGRSRLRVVGVTFDLVAEAAFVRTGTTMIPLGAALQGDRDQLWIPLQFVTDVLPRMTTSLRFESEGRVLRAVPILASTAGARASRVDSPSTRPAVAPTRVIPRPAATPPSAAPVRARAARTVVVDAGHGGPDAGMHAPLGGGAGLEEKDVTLAIARALRDALQARGVEVVMTRNRDTLVALADRGRIANRQRGDLFVSIHVNAANPAWRDAAGTRGFETYFLADAKSEDARRIAALENESVRFEGGPGPQSERDPLDFIISDMTQNEHLRESSRFASLVQRSLGAAHPGPSRGVKQAGFKVLVTASMPAVLVEVGYGTNPADASFITGDRGQRAIAGAIADAAVQYLSRAVRSGSPTSVVP